MAKDLSKLSDEELERIAGQGEKQSVIASMSDEELERIASAKSTSSEPSLGKDVYVKTTEGLLFGARPFVAGVGAGVGRSIGELERGDIGLLDRIKNLPERFQAGFSEGKQEAIAEEADVADRRPGLSAAIGVGTALATAPLLAAKGLQATRAGGILSGVGQSAKIGAGLGAAQALGHAESTGEAIEDIAKGSLLGGGLQIGGNVATKAAPIVAGLASKGAKKIASALTGVSEKEIQTYAQRANKIKELVARSGGDMSEAADQIRSKVSRDIQVTRQKIGAQIGAALDDPKYQNVLIDAKPVVQKLDESLSAIGKTTARFRPDEINELKNIRDLVTQSLDADGRIDLKTLSELKEELQAIAKPSYNNGAVIFPRGDLAAKASKGAAGEARRLLNVAAPEIKAANDQLRKLHVIEEGMNKNLIRVGKPESALIAAGAGGNSRNAKFLSQIDEITGGNSLQQAEDLAAARTFSNASLDPRDMTGKAAYRLAAGTLGGGVLGGVPGAAVGGALTSPLALRTAIDTGRFLGRIAAATGRGIGRVLPNTPSGTGQAAFMTGAQRGAANEASAYDNAVNRRLRFLDNNRNTKTGRGQ